MSSKSVMVATVTVCHDGNLYHAYSEDVFGLYLSAEDVDSLNRDVESACKYLFRKNHNVEVEMRPVSDRHAFPQPVHIAGKYAIGTIESQAAAIA